MEEPQSGTYEGLSALPRLKELRVRRGWTLQQLADASGVNIKTINRIERGAAKAQDLTAQKLANALGVDRKALIFPDEQIEAANRENAEMNEMVYRQLASMTDEQLSRLVNGPMYHRLSSLMVPPEARDEE